MNKHVVFVGGGNMATALLGGLLRGGWSEKSFSVVEPDAEQRARLLSLFALNVVASAADLAESIDVVVWAVKPQVMASVAAENAARFRRALNISIVSAIEIDTLCRWMMTYRVIRTMPNTPALVSSGVTGMLAAIGASAEDKALAESIMSAAGKVYWVASDAEIDSVCAVTGSGPGYVFYFLEAMQKAAEALGFEPQQAREMVLLNAFGSVKQALAQSESLAMLRERVTSNGGTTAAALAVLDAAGMSAAIGTAMSAAKLRAEAMAHENLDA